MSTPNRVGGDVDAFCTKCKLKLGHTALAMVGNRIARVRCNTCQGEHAYRANPPGTSTRAPREKKPRSSKPDARAADLDELLEGRDASHAHRYSANELFTKGEVVDHPTFGLGVVVDVRGDRFDLVFRAGVKTLAQRKAYASLAKRNDRPQSASDAADDAAEAEAAAAEQKM